MCGLNMTQWGPLSDFIGVVVVAVPLMVTKKQAIALGGSYWGGATDEENLKMPTVRDRLKSRNITIIGLLFILAGFALQFFGSFATPIHS